MNIDKQPYPFDDSDAGINWDTITPTFNATSDVYQYYLSSVLVKTITINYSDATKEVITSITKV